MKYLTIITLLITSIITLGCNKYSKPTQLKELTIDTKNALAFYDISALCNADIQIISLETQDECLTLADSKIVVTQQYIIAANVVNHKLLLFDSNGKYLKAIANQGKGPHEYVELGDFTIVNDTIYIQDLQQDKILKYSIADNTLQDIVIYPPIYYQALIGHKNSISFLTDYSLCDGEYYNLINIDHNNKRIKHIPFNKEISDNNQRWALKKYVGQYQDTALVVFSRNDTIYSVAEKSVNPLYHLNFTEHKMPTKLLNAKGVEIYRQALDNGYNLGVDRICCTKNYVLGDFWANFQDYTFIYNKTTDSLIVSSAMLFGDLGCLPLPPTYTTTDNDDLVLIYDATLLQAMLPQILQQHFANAENKRKFELLSKIISDQNNPILMKVSLKTI